ncbi:MAG TPA: D-aminoacyl-tRNA deacylase [Bacteroidales bacterium]|nr:D-aminoacyl-tRNA deacylase [Bacteroidales bacterium]
MRAVIQRVQHSTITINDSCTRSIGKGCLVLLGIEDADNADDARWLAGKIARLRIFADENDKMNQSIIDIEGDIMVVSQFTLHASTKKGNRPSWIKAANPQIAEPIYHDFVKLLETETGKKVITGVFGAYMKIDLLNDGPVTIFIDTKNKE